MPLLTITDDEQAILRATAVRLGVTEEELVRKLFRGLNLSAETPSEEELMARQPPFIRELLASFPPIPEEESRQIPSDVSQNVDHYAYGTTKP